MKVVQFCPILFNYICTIHGILQARILEWVAVSFSRGSSQPRNEPRSPLQAHPLPATFRQLILVMFNAPFI